MPQYVVTGPDGQKYRVTAPEGASEAEVLARVRTHAGDFSASASGRANVRPSPPLKRGDVGQVIKQRAAAAAKGVGWPITLAEDAGRAAQTIANYGVDAVGTTALNALGFPNAANWWHRGAALDRDALQRQPTYRKAIEAIVPPPQDTTGKVADFATEVLVPTGLASLPKSVFGPAFNPTTPRPQFPTPGNANGGNLVSAGQRAGVPVRKPDANPALRNKVAAVEASPYGGPRVQAAYADDAALIQKKAGALGGGVPDEAYNIGNRLQGAGKKFIERTGKQFGKLYDEVDDLSQGVKVNPQTAIRVVDENIAELTANGAAMNADQISFLAKLRSDLVKPGGMSMGEFRGLRSAAKAKIRGDQGLTVTDATRRLGSVVSAFSDDAFQQLPPEAVRVLRETDAAYAQRQALIDSVLKPHVLGTKGRPKSPEMAARNITALTQSRADFDTINDLWRILDPQTQADFATTIASKLGVMPGGPFQMGRLASDVNKIPSNIRGVLWGDEGAQKLNDLALLARAKSDTMGAFNSSRTTPAALGQLGSRVGQGLGVGSATGIASGNLLLGILAAAGTEGARAGSQIMRARGLLGSASTPANMALPTINVGQGVMAAAQNPAVKAQLPVVLNEPLLARLAAEENEKDKRRKQR